MFKPGRRDPRFYVAHLSGPDAVARFEDAVRRRVPVWGKITFAIGGDRHVLARPVAEALRISLPRGEGETSALHVEGFDLLKRLGAELAGVMPGSDLAVFLRHADQSVRPPPSPAPLPPGALWNLDAVRAPKAVGIMDAERPGWRSERIAQIDTGYTAHPAFRNWSSAPTQQVRLDLDRDLLDDPADDDALDPLDYDGNPGHGTRVMSVIAGDANVAGFRGVAPGLETVPVRITRSVVIDFLGNGVRLPEAIAHAWKTAGCRAVNISLGDPWLPPPAVGRAVDAAYENGIAICCAAGNITSEVTYPGRYSRTIAVAGVGRDLRPWSGSSRGDKVDLSAPADDVWRADSVLDGGGSPVYGYGGGGSGTSFAVAHVSAGAAMWFAWHRAVTDPRWNVDTRYPEPWMRVEAFRHCLRRSAYQPGVKLPPTFGAGIADLAALLRLPLPAPSALTKRPEARSEKC